MLWFSVPICVETCLSGLFIWSSFDSFKRMFADADFRVSRIRRLNVTSHICDTTFICGRFVIWWRLHAYWMLHWLFQSLINDRSGRILGKGTCDIVRHDLCFWNNNPAAVIKCVPSRYSFHLVHTSRSYERLTSANFHYPWNQCTFIISPSVCKTCGRVS